MTEQQPIASRVQKALDTVMQTVQKACNGLVFEQEELKAVETYVRTWLSLKDPDGTNLELVGVERVSDGNYTAKVRSRKPVEQIELTFTV